MNAAAWEMHLENTKLLNEIRVLRAELWRERQRRETWRNRAMNARPAGRATPKYRP